MACKELGISGIGFDDNSEYIKVAERVNNN